MSTFTRLSAPAADAAAVVPDDTTEQPGKALYVGTGGDVELLTEAGSEVTFLNVPAGFILPVRFRRVLEGTDADDLVRLIET